MKIKFCLKMIALILCLLVISNFYVFGEEKESNDKNYEIAINTLKSLNIVDEKDLDGKYGDTIIKREFGAYVISKLVNYVNNDDNLHYFNDTSDSLYRKNINTLIQYGAINVNEERLFYPNNDLTYLQVGKMIVSILGYTNKAEAKGGYPFGYIDVINSIKLFSDIKTQNYDNSIPLSDFVLIVNKALICDMLEVEAIENDRVIYKNNKSTILENFFDIKRDDGIVTVTRYLKMYENIDLQEDEVIIDGIKYKSGTTNVSDFIGQKIEFFYKEDNEVREILAVNPNRFLNKRVQIMSEDIEIVDKNSITYLVDDNQKKISFDKNTVFIYNGRAIVNESTILEKLKPVNGIITCISNNANSTYNVVMVYDYDNYVVDSVDMKNKVISVSVRKDDYSKKLLNDKIYADDSNTTYDVVMLRDGNQIDIEDIKKGQILSVSESLESEDKILTIWASYQSISGKIAEVIDDKIIIDGITYCVDNKYKDKMIFELNKIKTFYLDEASRIAYYKIEAQSTEKYGYLANVAKAKSAFESDCRFKILSIEDGKMYIYNSSKNITLNNSRNYDGKAVDGRYIADLIFNEPDYGELIKYTLDEDKEILNITIPKDVIDVPLEQQDENEFRLNYNGNIQFGSRLANQYRIDNKISKYIFVPAEPSEDDNDYYVSTSIPRNQYSARLYDIGRDMMSKFVVIKGVSKTEASSVPANSVPLIVKDISKSVNKDGVAALKLNGFMDGQEVSYIFSDTVNRVAFCNRNDTAELPDGTIVTYPTKVDWYIDDGWLENHSVPLKNYTELESGDMIQFITNRDGEISYYRLVMDIRRTGKIENGIQKTWNDWDNRSSMPIYNYQYDSGLYVAYAKVIDLANGNLVINPKSSDGFPAVWNQSFSLTKSNFYIYDKSTKTVKRGSVSDVIKGDYVAVRVQSIVSKIDVLIIR